MLMISLATMDGFHGIVIGKTAMSNERNFMSNLAQKECVACKPGTPPLKGEALASLARQLAAGWQVVEEHHLEREYKFANFRDALAFTNKVGELAESQNHHPDIYLAWGKVKLTLWTHSIGGLSESDFIFCRKSGPAQRHAVNGA